MFKHIKPFALIILAAIFLTGCLNGSPEEKIFKILEEVVVKENGFKEQQTPLVDLEKKESDIYSQIIKLGIKDYDKIVSLSNEALQNIDKREEHIKKEHDSIGEAEKEFKKIEELIKDIEKEDARNKAIKLNNTMKERFKVHEILYKAYLESLKKDRELYGLFKQKDLRMEDLQKKIDEVNQTYDKVIKENDKFNKLTEEYNKEKMEFYKSAGLKVS
ncbi:hypothetical protein D0469_03965 [Peribacillus saganii]|uniref:Cell-wall binding lipoprotein n=1 Tax=Peribacillus saganii TaxID=2303992 RepID=A0A372LU71_9BACI|nr:YkyA family protein [Peribacillus saganii]RFU71104.1 hypothetical protein D0469_03965 [Peribacillus saganii]